MLTANKHAEFFLLAKVIHKAFQQNRAGQPMRRAAKRYPNKQKLNYRTYGVGAVEISRVSIRVARASTKGGVAARIVAVHKTIVSAQQNLI